MTATVDFSAGGYRFLPGVFQDSGGVAALSGHAIERLGFRTLLSLKQGVERIGRGWADHTATQVYTVRDLYPFLADEIVRRGAAHAGLTWHYARPPVQELEFEVDCRSVGRERIA